MSVPQVPYLTLTYVFGQNVWEKVPQVPLCPPKSARRGKDEQTDRDIGGGGGADQR